MTSGGAATPAANEAKLIKGKQEIARAAVLANHAAASMLAAAGDRQVARLLRAAEALSRQAVALVGIVGSPAAAAPAEQVKQAQSRSAVRRRRRRAKAEKEKALKESKANKEQGATVPIGGSVVLGDLTELGVNSGCLVIPPLSAGSAALPPSSMTPPAASASGHRASSGEVMEVDSQGTARRKWASGLREGQHIVISAGPFAGLGGTVVPLGTGGGNLRLDQDGCNGKGKGRRGKEVHVFAKDF